jgi:PKD repeat protein
MVTVVSRGRWKVLSRRAKAMAAVFSMVAAGLFAIAVATAPQASAILPGVPPIAEPTANNAAADALPTAQIDGVVWTQVVIGNKVYAGGDFANARPAGAAPGTNLVPRTDLLAYDITTGVLDPTFAPVFDAQVKSLAKSPDGSRLYVGGQFTSVNGVNRYRIAAFDTATGALINTFAPALDYIVQTIVATNTTVYVGGGFSQVSGTPRTRLAAFSAADGSLLSWAPTADDTVSAMVMTPSGSKLIIGGSFKNVNGASAYGMGALDPNTGALVPWAAGNTIKDAGSASAINSLSSDGTAIYGTGYVFGAGGNLEGTFSADPESGNINWIEDCHGDTYSAFGMNNVVYTVSHSHLCSNVGAFPQTNPWTMHRALAWTHDAVGTIAHDTQGYFDWFGNPAPSQYNWYPDLTPGTFTNQDQAAWNVTGNGTYLVMGGEFTSVNFGGGQQGLVRFAVKPPSPGKQGPRLSAASFVPTVNATSSHTARITWQTNWDRDNQNLTYKVIRDNVPTAPIYTTSAVSQFWNRPNLNFVDTGLNPGQTYNYKIYALDPSGNTAQGNNVSITMPLTDPSPYVTAVFNDGASNYWRLGEASGTTGVDTAGFNNLVLASGVGHNATGAISGDANKASTFNGTSNGTAGTTNPLTAPDTFTIEAWIKTTSPLGGKIMGFGSSRSGSSSSYDRHIYMDNSGHIIFGVYPGATKTVASSGTYRNGQFHYVAATLSSAGMALYVDGARVGFDATVTSGQAYQGYWRLGGDALASWPSKPLSDRINGTIDDAAVYPTALSAARIQGHYLAASGFVNQPPVAAFTSSCTDLSCSFNGSSSSDPGGSVTGYDWDFGDGTTGTGVTPSHTYATGGNKSVTLTVTDNLGLTNAKTQTVTAIGPNQLPTAAFTPTCSNLTCTFNGSASSDSDGSITGFAWDFGDGATDTTGATVSHTYATGNTYPVTLTVTDNRSGTNALTQNVTVAQSPFFASDAFGRTSANGWGTADIGGPWTTAGVTAANFSVSSGSARVNMTAAGNLPTAYLNGATIADSNSQVDVTFDKAFTGTGYGYAYLSARHVGTSQYRLRAKVLATGAVQLSLTKVVGTETVLVTSTIAGLSFTPGQSLTMRLQVSGGGLSGKIWVAGSAEPAAWQVTSTDASPLAAGGTGVAAYLASSATTAPVLATFDNLIVTAL